MSDPTSTDRAVLEGRDGLLTIDIHVHLTGLGNGGTGCFVSDRMKRAVVFRILKWWLGIDPADPQADRKYAAALAKLVQSAEHVDAAVVFGMDGVYDSQGRLVREKSHLVVPNEYVFEICRAHDGMLPGPSIHPGRADAMDELARVDEAGAVLIKWLPPLQWFDPSERRYDRFYEELARRGIPLLAHTGCEHTFPDCHHAYGHAALYERAASIGTTLIFAHCGAACRFHQAHHQTDEVLRMMAAHPQIYADTSALASLLKSRYLTTIPFGDFPGRFVHGSDYPIPSLPMGFARKLGLGKTLELSRHPNAIELDWQIKSAVGQPPEVFTNASRVLGPRIAKWRGKRAASREAGVPPDPAG